MIRSTGGKINELFGLSDSDTLKLIDKIQSKWEVLVSGDEEDRFTFGDLLVSIANNNSFTDKEKCFLCYHVSKNFEIIIIRELFLSYRFDELSDELGLINVAFAP